MILHVLDKAFALCRPQRPHLRRPLCAFSFLGLLTAAMLSASPAKADSQIDPMIDPMIDIAEEIGCLALNIYFEARGEPDLGKVAVAHVVLNRVIDTRFPTTVCDVVRQGGEQTLHRCQFSWWCDGRSDKPHDAQSWRQVQAVARQVYWGFSPDPTEGALWYHADSVSPYWRTAFNQGPKIGQHIFYSDDAPAPQLTSLPIYD